MKLMFITLTHANVKKQAEVAVNLIAAYWYSEAHKATLVMATGGAMIPVLESPEEVRAKIDESQK